MELTKNGNNAAITISLLSDAEMRKAGFGEWIPGNWHYLADVSNAICFHLVVSKEDASDFKIGVQDEGWEYNYRKYLENNNDTALKKIFLMVEREMARLAALGIVRGHVYGEYI